MSTSSFPSDLNERSLRLKGLHQRLCKHHFGIDAEIQRLLDAFAPWFCFAEAQTRPRTIGLWGMTGTGKSSLVRALVKEMGLEDRTFWLDAGESRGNSWLDRAFDRVEEDLNGQPFIVVVDEFQHARTVRGMEERIESGMLRQFWEMLDSGRIITWPSGYGRLGRHTSDLAQNLSAALANGAEVLQGRLVAGTEVYNEHMPVKYKPQDKLKWAVHMRYWGDLADLHPSPKPTAGAIGDILSKLDGPGVVKWLEDVHTTMSHNRVVDASKMLVIVLGNLDELYVNDKEPIAEIDPDVLLLRHRDIGTSGVQHALCKLFRIEQVGRLGASHIVFPPIGRATVNVLVQDAVNDLTTRLSRICGRDVEVDTSLVEHIAATSTIAVLGARPVVQAIQNIVPLLLSQVQQKAVAFKASTVRLAMVGKEPCATLTRGFRQQDHTLVWPAAANANAVQHELLERVAVHEVGHLLCGMLLEGRKPLQVCVQTRDPETAGFVIWEDSGDLPFLRSDIVPRLAGMLGGWAAERMVYGPDGLSYGCEDDLRKASALALAMVKECGMGEGPFFITEPASVHRAGFRKMLGSAERQAKEWIEAAQELATNTLRTNRDLLDQWCGRLVAEGSIGPAALEEMIGMLPNRTTLRVAVG